MREIEIEIEVLEFLFLLLYQRNEDIAFARREEIDIPYRAKSHTDMEPKIILFFYIFCILMPT